MISIRNLQDLPKFSGIYQVIDKEGTVIYVGQAKNIYQRWKNGHHKLSEIINLCGVNAYIESIEVSENLLNRAENMAISHFRPKLNFRTPPIV
jgi:excinuclease UvrABC nuclease subunit